MKVQIELTPTQIKTVEKMKKGIWYSAYDLRVGVNTLNALYSKGVVNKRVHPGYIWSPRTSLRFRLI